MPILSDDEKLKAEFERVKEVTTSALEFSEEEIDELRIALLDELASNSPMTLDGFNEVLDKEFSVFKAGEKYTFVKDLKDAYSDSL